MPSRYTFGRHFEESVKARLTSGRCNNASEVVRDPLRLMEEPERNPAALDIAIGQGLADLRAGRVHDAEAVFAELEAEVEALRDRPAL